MPRPHLGQKTSLTSSQVGAHRLSQGQANHLSLDAGRGQALEPVDNDEPLH